MTCLLNLSYHFQEWKTCEIYEEIGLDRNGTGILSLMEKVKKFEQQSKESYATAPYNHDNLSVAKHWIKCARSVLVLHISQSRLFFATWKNAVIGWRNFPCVWYAQGAMPLESLSFGPLEVCLIFARYICLLCVRNLSPGIELCTNDLGKLATTLRIWISKWKIELMMS